MRSHVILVPVFTLALAAQARPAADHALVARWSFDGELRDGSGRGHDAVGANARFRPASAGSGLDAHAGAVVVADASDLRLQPGLRAECLVRFDAPPDGYQHVFRKDGEYMLRVDAPHEGGCFSFFVFVNGSWEPRVRSKEPPRAGAWYRLVARWDGRETFLEVDGDVTRSLRSGSPAPAGKPLEIGAMGGVIDELRIESPGARAMEAIAGLTAGAGDRTRETASGAAKGWPGWEGVSGARHVVRGGALEVTLPDAGSMVVHPALAIDVTRRGYVCCDVTCDTAATAVLTFVTDTGSGSVPVSLGGSERTTIVDLATLAGWRGTLTALAFSVPGAAGSRLRLTRLWISGRPEGRPYLYARNLAPGRAVLRVGREETIVAVVRNLGAEATDARARLVLPRGAACVNEGVVEFGTMPPDAIQMATWRVRAGRALGGKAEVRLSSNEGEGVSASCAVEFLPPVRTKATYVPEPRPATTAYTLLMHYCPLWKEGTHYGWERIESWPERRPAIGWYDEGTGVVADWQIAYALEHGIQGFIYCWYRDDFSPEIHQHLPHGIHEGLFSARYLDRFRFCIMWENGCAKGVTGRDDLMRNLFPFWMKNYFTHPSYVKIDNKPVLFVWRPELVRGYFGSAAATRAALDEMRAACRAAGFDGLWVVGCVPSAYANILKNMAEEGWDASSAYGTHGTVDSPPATDIEGIATVPHAAACAAEVDVWRAKKEIGALPDIVSVMVGWDPRPWHGRSTSSYQADVSPGNFRAACLAARDIVERTPGSGLDKRVVVFDNWNEFGEGHYIEPCVGFGFQFLDVIRGVFCTDRRPCRHVAPEDVGLAAPEHVYLARREALGLGRPVTRIVSRDTMSRSRLCSVKRGGAKEATTPGVFPPVPEGRVPPSR